MTPTALAGFLAIVAVGAYVQTLTGFAFGLVVMGGVGLTGVLPLPIAAVIVSMLVLVNAAQVLARGWRDIGRRELGLMLLGSLPALPIGYAVLIWLADERLAGVRLLLGSVILVSAIQLLVQAGRRGTRSGDASFVGFGAIAGLMGGLFSTAGPPLVYHMYRQPFTPARIRETLVSVFAINALLRLGIVTWQGQMTSDAAVTALVAAPVVAVATFAARRWPPALSPHGIRLVVFCLLTLSGLSLAAPAVPALWNALIIHIFDGGATGWRDAFAGAA